MENGEAPERNGSYQDTLRAIGRYFDEQVYRNVLICEVADGYVARAFPLATTESAKAEGLQFLHEDIGALVQHSREVRNAIPDFVKMPPLCPTGYEDFLRAVGWECDGAGVQLISVVEMKEGILVNYYQPSTRSPSGSSWHQTFYDADGITALLNRGFGRRGQHGST